MAVGVEIIQLAMDTTEVNRVLTRLFSELVDGPDSHTGGFVLNTGDAIELTGMIGSIAHLAYHLGAIRQIDKQTRGPREGTF